MRRFVYPFIYIVLFLLVCTVLPVAGAEEEEFDEEIVVTAAKIPQPITEAPGMVQTIDEETITKNQNQSVAEVLMAKGFTVSTTGGENSQANIQLGGASAEQTLVMVDGIPLYGGTMDQVDLSYFPVAGVEKIEVVNGPLSALYGSNALGGVVNIIPNLTGEPEHRFYLSGGSFGSGRGSLQLSRERWGLVIGGSRTGGHRPHSAADCYNLAAQIDLIQNENDFLKLYGGYRTKKAQIPGSETWPSEDKQEDENLFLSLTGERSFADSALEAKLSYQSWDNYYETIYRKDRHLSTRWGSDLTFRHDRGAHRFLAGMAFNYDHIDSTTAGNRQRHTLGLYLQDLWDLNDQLLMHSGLRWDRVGQDQALSPRIGITWFITDHFNLGLNYGTAFRAPSMNDLYFNDEYAQGNPDLIPEKGEKWEITGHWLDSQMSVTANLFLSQLQDGINWSLVNNKYTPENIEKIKTSGFNLNVTYNWGPIETGFGYAFMDKRGWDSPQNGYSKDLNHFGQHRFHLKGEADLGKLICDTGCQVVLGRVDTLSGEKLPDYLLLSAGLRYQLGTNYTLSLEVENLTDTKYQIQKGYPMPGRSFKLMLSGCY